MPQDHRSPLDKQSSSSTPSTSGTPGDDLGKAKDALAKGAHQLTDEVKHAAVDAADGVKKAASSQMDAGRDFAANELGSLAYALRKTGEELGSKDSGLTDYVAKAASSVDELSSYVQTRTLSQLMGDVEGFARREPAMFLGGAFVAGLFGGRFLKSSSRAASRAGGNGAWDGDRTTLPNALPAYAGQGTRTYRAEVSPLSESQKEPAGQAPYTGESTGDAYSSQQRQTAGTSAASSSPYSPLQTTPASQPENRAGGDTKPAGVTSDPDKAPNAGASLKRTSASEYSDATRPVPVTGAPSVPSTPRAMTGTNGGTAGPGAGSR